MKIVYHQKTWRLTSTSLIASCFGIHDAKLPQVAGAWGVFIGENVTVNGDTFRINFPSFSTFISIVALWSSHLHAMSDVRRSLRVVKPFVLIAGHPTFRRREGAIEMFHPPMSYPDRDRI